MTADRRGGAKRIDRREGLRRERFLAEILETSVQPFGTGYPDGRMGVCNRAFCELTGYSPEELHTTSWRTMLTPPEWIGAEMAALAELDRTGKPVRYEKEYITKDGRRVPVELLVHPLRDQAGHVELYCCFVTDITERKQMHEALRKSHDELELRVRERTKELSATNEALLAEIEQRRRAEEARQESEEAFRTLAESVPQLVWICNPDGLNVYFNRRWVEYTGLTLEESYGTGWNTPFHPDDKQPAWNAWNQAVENGGTYRIECRLRRADGSYHWFLTKGVPMRDATGRIVKWFGTCTDIDDLKRAQEEQLRSLLEKETLLKEIHHRVKNNLQIICSLLMLQEGSLTDPGAAAVLRESRQRVLSMALIHERLYSSPKMDEIDFGDYTQTIVRELFNSYASTATHVTSRLDVSPVRLKIGQAIPCALILNEVVTNALKYAYPKGYAGEVIIELKETPAGHIQLTVSDHGIGLPEGLDWKKAQSLGLRIVDVLAEQLDGKLRINSGPGVTFSLDFPGNSAGGVRIASAP
ncbi:MAG: PAS domain S-box protein [Bryobacteraceae bacterium]